MKAAELKKCRAMTLRLFSKQGMAAFIMQNLAEAMGEEGVYIHYGGIVDKRLTQ